tara:strand:+ start:15157 stop:16995 length:1839 start_codon:yes stop_codon:yes gene_type:complete
MVLDFTQELIKQSHEIVIVTREYSYPIQSCFSGLDVKVFVGSLPHELYEKFDLAIAFHPFTIKALLKNGFKPKKLIYFSLGPSEPFETPPVINKGVFGLGCFNSQETFEHYLNHGYVCKDDSLVFPNSVADSFFCDVPTKALPTKISKVAIITNHSSSLHTELKKLLSLSEISITFLGRTEFGNSRLITPQLLLGFDLVVTMGRSVQHCMALGVPVFLYDKFGGCGFLNKDNYLAEERFNYSGRASRRQLTADEIVKELKNGFTQSQYDIEFFKELAKNKYSLNKNLNQLLKRVEDIEGYNSECAFNFFQDAAIYEKLLVKNKMLSDKVKSLTDKLNYKSTFDNSKKNEMKLSISFNFFNGEEYFYQNVFNMRKVAEHISIVYQDISNHGNAMSLRAKSILNKIIQNGLVDDVSLYTPDLSLSPSENEFKKRKLGERLARNNSCTHFLIMDTDEFYDRKEFNAAKRYILKHDISYSACPSYFYLKKPTYRSLLKDKTNVSFICRLDSNTEFKRGGYFPVDNVDPTRRVINKEGNFKLFEEHTLVMHHMNFIRADNFKSKLSNSSNAHKVEFMNEVLLQLEHWKFGELFKFPKKGDFEIIEVENKFKLPDVMN